MFNIKYLIDKDQTDENGNTAFHLAVMYCKHDVVKFLIKHSLCDPLMRNNEGKTAL